jgi:arginine decarboxylase
MVVTYPPGIPILFPGEVISIGKVRELKGLVDGKAYITGARDTSLATIRVAKQ